MKRPRVSICLPNLNNRRFLAERLDSIHQQTFTDWELIIVDSYSDDGAWEFFQEQAQREPRIRLSQAPRHGIYAGWNNCLDLATGDYVYIATSDDTMYPTCLEKLVAALDAHPEIALASCGLDIIDGQSRVQEGQWLDLRQAAYFRDWLDQPHRRPGFSDFCWTLVLQGVPHISITTLLIRRELFARTGQFATNLGGTADRAWYWVASLYTDILHIPERLATWRAWMGGATSNPGTPQMYLDYYRVSVEQIFAQHERRLKELSPVPLDRLKAFFEEDPYYARRLLISDQRKSRWRKALEIAWLGVSAPVKVLRELWQRMTGLRDFTQTYRFNRADEITRWLQLSPPQVVR